MRTAEEWKQVQFTPLGSDTPNARFACPDCNVAFILPQEHECPPPWMKPSVPYVVVHGSIPTDLLVRLVEGVERLEQTVFDVGEALIYLQQKQGEEGDNANA